VNQRVASQNQDTRQATTAQMANGSPKITCCGPNPARASARQVTSKRPKELAPGARRFPRDWGQPQCGSAGNNGRAADGTSETTASSPESARTIGASPRTAPAGGEATTTSRPERRETRRWSQEDRLGSSRMNWPRYTPSSPSEHGRGHQALVSAGHFDARSAVERFLQFTDVEFLHPQERLCDPRDLLRRSL